MISERWYTISNMSSTMEVDMAVTAIAEAVDMAWAPVSWVVWQVLT
eukprot:SAG31_NODE_7450_length_1686_cov_1.654064_1_plen_46_part_00